jgi:DNA adenine methylase
MQNTLFEEYRSVNPPLKWHGGKHYLAPKFIALMPPHVHYVEPFAGGLAVLLAKDPAGVSEVVNDLNGDLINFWEVLRSPDLFEQFRRMAEATPFSEYHWQISDRVVRNGHGGIQPDVGQAYCFFVHVRQSLAARQDGFATLTRKRVRRGMNEQASAWLTSVDGLPAVHERLKRVVILNRPALEVIAQQDDLDTLFYCDPPYLRQTRTAPDVYGHEMSDADHRQLLDLLLRCQGKVMLSGYPSPLYDTALADWKRHTFDLPNNAASGTKKDRETEVLWCNFG